MPVRTVDFPPELQLRETVRGAKNPVLIGPTEARWSTRTPDGLGSLTLHQRPDHTVDAEAWGPGADWLLDRVPGLLGASDDPSGFEPPAPLRDRWRRNPFRLARTGVLWDAMVGAVFGQKVQTANAVRSRRMLARRHGDPAPGPEGPRGPGWILPAPERVAEMGYHQFHPLGVERKRAETLIRVAREMPRLAGLADGDPADAAARLCRIRGVGPWTAAMATAVAMGDPDAVPVGDFHIPNVVAWVLAGEPRATDERMLELLEPWAGHRWRVIRLAKSSGPAPRYGPRLSLTGDGLHQGR
jgi:hypothetical protein